jgi:hypothetical protein
MVTLAGVEPATCGLGNRRSIHLSYRATRTILTRKLAPRNLTTAEFSANRIGRITRRGLPFPSARRFSLHAGNLFNNADALLNHGLSRRFR